MRHSSLIAVLGSLAAVAAIAIVHAKPNLKARRWQPAAGDGYGATCVGERSGDAILDPDEECDAGDGNNDVIAVACRLACIAPRCGEGVVDPGEACDVGTSAGWLWRKTGASKRLNGEPRARLHHC